MSLSFTLFSLCTCLWYMCVHTHVESVHTHARMCGARRCLSAVFLCGFLPYFLRQEVSHSTQNPNQLEQTSSSGNSLSPPHGCHGARTWVILVYHKAWLCMSVQETELRSSGWHSKHLSHRSPSAASSIPDFQKEMISVQS